MMDDLFPLIEALQLLGFAHVSGGDIELTPAGRAFADADMLTRKQIFADALDEAHSARRAYPPGARRAARPPRAGSALPARARGPSVARKRRERVLDTVINWGRHAEIFAYDYDREVLSLENPRSTPNAATHTGARSGAARRAIDGVVARRRYEPAGAAGHHRRASAQPGPRPAHHRLLSARLCSGSAFLRPAVRPLRPAADAADRLGDLHRSRLPLRLAPTIDIMIAVRLLQGFGGAVGVVVTRAAARDHFGGPRAAQTMSSITAVQAFGPLARRCSAAFSPRISIGRRSSCAAGAFARR